MLDDDRSSDDHSVDGQPQMEGMAYLCALQSTQVILQDASAFLRNNHMVYTSGITLAIERLAQGDEAGALLLRSMKEILNHNEQYLEKIVDTCVQTLVKYKRLDRDD